MSELLPCPFCGGDAYPATIRYDKSTVREQGWTQDTFHYLSCCRCAANNRGLVGYATPDDAATHWNKRTAARGSRVPDAG